MSYYQVRMAAPYGEGAADIQIKSGHPSIQGMGYHINAQGGKSAGGVFGQFITFPPDVAFTHLEWRVPADDDGYTYFRGEIPELTSTWQYIAVYEQVVIDEEHYQMFWQWFDEHPYQFDDYHREIIEWVPPPPPEIDLEYAASVSKRVKFLMAWNGQSLEFYSSQIGPHDWFEAVMAGEQHVEDYTRENIDGLLDGLVAQYLVEIEERKADLTEQRRRIRAEAEHIKAAEALL